MEILKKIDGYIYENRENALERILSILKSKYRNSNITFVTSDRTRFNVITSKLKFKNNHKPPNDCVWYAKGGDWAEWLLHNQPDWIGDSIYEIDVNVKDMIILFNDRVYKEFFEKYSENEHHIRWKEVSKDYKGIWLNVASGNHPWINLWDIDSGAIWDKSVIRKNKLIFSYNEEMGEFE